MNSNKESYCDKELNDTLEKNSLEFLRLKVSGDKYSSKWLDLNLESIKSVERFLNKVKDKINV